MAEYIEREALISLIKARNGRVPNWINDCISDCPTADARPERHGQWIEYDGYQVCSECGEEHAWDSYRATYCEDCGAKMDGKEV